MTAWKQYHKPRTVSDALTLLRQYGEGAAIVAGGTDLILDLEFGRKEPVEALVDLTSVEGLDRIEEESGWIVIGAAATHAAIASHPLIRLHAAALAEGSAVIGGPQVRNVATIGGNIAHALPAADGTTALMVLDAEVLIHSSESSANGTDAGRWKPIADLFAGPGKNSLKSGELIGAVRIPRVGERKTSAFDRIMRPQGIALPMLGFAASVELDPDSEDITAAALCFGPAGPVPFRCREAEECLLGFPADKRHITEAVSVALNGASFRTSRHRATEAYRREMVEVLMNRVIPRACRQAAESSNKEQNTKPGESEHV